MTDCTDEDALRLDIAMALSKIKTKPRGDREDVYRKMVAEQIVAHLKAVELALREGAADATAQVLGARALPHGTPPSDSRCVDGQPTSSMRVPRLAGPGA
jgi:hypothetical protein